MVLKLAMLSNQSSGEGEAAKCATSVFAGLWIFSCSKRSLVCHWIEGKIRNQTFLEIDGWNACQLFLPSPNILHLYFLRAQEKKGRSPKHLFNVRRSGSDFESLS